MIWKHVEECDVGRQPCNLKKHINEELESETILFMHAYAVNLEENYKFGDVMST